MSVTTYYGRLSPQQYEAMGNDPDGLAQFITGDLPAEQLLYLDKATPVIAWLLSPLKRHEQSHYAAVVQAYASETPFTRPDLGAAPPMDDLLYAIEGRGDRDERLDVGLGPACVIPAADVSRYAAALAAIDEPALRANLDFQALDDASLPIDCWAQEGDPIFDDYIHPLFLKLQAFYQSAAASSQCMLVWYS